MTGVETTRLAPGLCTVDDGAVHAALYANPRVIFEAAGVLAEYAFAERAVLRIVATTMAVNLGPRRSPENADRHYVRTFVEQWPGSHRGSRTRRRRIRPRYLAGQALSKLAELPALKPRVLRRLG